MFNEIHNEQFLQKQIFGMRWRQMNEWVQSNFTFAQVWVLDTFMFHTLLLKYTCWWSGCSYTLHILFHALIFHLCSSLLVYCSKWRVTWGDAGCMWARDGLSSTVAPKVQVIIVLLLFRGAPVGSLLFWPSEGETHTHNGRLSASPTALSCLSWAGGLTLVAEGFFFFHVSKRLSNEEERYWTAPNIWPRFLRVERQNVQERRVRERVSAM